MVGDGCGDGGGGDAGGGVEMGWGMVNRVVDSQYKRHGDGEGEETVGIKAQRGVWDGYTCR